MVASGANTTVVCLLLAVFSSVQCYEHLSRHGNALLFNPEFEYESDFRHDLEHELLPHEERSYYYHGEPDAAEHAFHHADYSLANLRPISPTPAFTLDPSYISPADIVPARAKRANRIRSKSSSRQRKREQKERELLPEERDDDDEEEEEEDGGVERNDQGNSGESTDVDDYAERYEQFIAKHFEDLENKRKKSAAQRKAPKNKKPSTEEGDDEDDDEKDGDYKFDRFDYSSSEDYERIKAESEEQSRRLAKDPGNCRTYEKDGMVCSVCHDPASDSASESCAYATEPHHRKYAYVKERNYDSKKDDPNREKATESADEDDHDEHEADREHTSAETRPERQTDIAGSLGPTPVPKRVPTRPLRKPTLRSKPHQSATNGGGYRYQPIDLRSNRANMKLTVAKDSENLPPPGKGEDIYVMDYADQDEVAKVLAEFKARDWSNCRKESRLVASEPVRPPPSMAGGKLRKRKKVVALTRQDLAAIEPVPANAANGVPPPKEKQTVKRTVSFRSFVTGSGRPRETMPSIGGPDGGERVIHYEHHISHEVP
ncbi:probable serine/threonine-protein kinase kinX [Anopheles maculipalpis]|uniref:probable serine/threonine-protein kinase kinX n=1 Tax=Anopheles maculipalpis TaxID=1496333 RepID=UPI002158E17E|nr:probable serine/threonine-protein kinase kinX [Anopheles maculipalpis]